jgi:hypothetical protein
MGCACTKRKRAQFLWYNGESEEPKIYTSEIEAKAKVLRKGGNYIPYNPNEPIGSQIAIAEAARVAAG